MSAEQLVNTAIEECLDGRRTWDPTAVDLHGLLRGIIRSLTSAERKKHVRAKTLTSSDAVEQHAGVVDSPEDAAVDEERRQQLQATIAACTDGDDDLQLFYLTVLDGHTKREDIAKALGWSGERVAVVHKKLQRRLVRAAPEFADVRARHRRTS